MSEKEQNRIDPTEELRCVRRSVRKKDSTQLLLGKPVYTADIIPSDALVIKLLRSPHANAIVETIDAAAAKKLPGVAAVYTWEDVPQQRFSNAGQTYPEPSPYDRLIIDRHVRFAGDVVAIIAAEDEQAALKALKLIKVNYRVLEPVLDFRTAKDSSILVHPEDDWKTLCNVGGDSKRNLVASGNDQDGDVEAVLNDCDIVIDRTYHTKAFNQAMMETFRTYAEMDVYGRLHIISSTQIIFHCRRIIANALGISKSRVRVEKPRIGGGFGAKQTAVSEIYPAFVTFMTGRPSLLVFSREETLVAGSPRHEMELHVRLGANRDGTIRAIDLYTLSNTGAYGDHGPTTVGLSGHKAIPIYSGSLEAYRFSYDVVYTNHQAAGAYRGYGATQGFFAVETAVNELAEKLGIDPVELRMRCMVKEGMRMPAYYGETATACSLDRCMKRCSERFGWLEKYPVRDLGNGKIRSAGVAICMQGSGISGVDVGSATLRLSDDGTYNLIVGSADMGTGSDTTLSQIAAENLFCDIDDVAVFSADTDLSPYDSGSYASSTAYVTGKAVQLACDQLRDKITDFASELLGCSKEETVFDGRFIENTRTGDRIPLSTVSVKSQAGNHRPFEVTVTHSSPVSPPPFMVGMAEIELDKETGKVDVVNYTSVLDCGTAINPALVRIQAEGGIVQGIGHTLTENITYDRNGKPMQNSFLQYKIPSRLDIGSLNVEIESSYEETGPHGAKSVGEVVINTPAPAIVHAIYRATGKWHYEIPVTPEQIVFGE